MRFFIKKIIIFLTPIGLIFLFSALVLLFGRELSPLSEVLKTQAAKPSTIFGLSYYNLDKFYKARLVADKNPEIIALGTSRVMQFRQEFFAPYKFVNAGGAAASPAEMEKFINELPPYSQVKFIILGLDSVMFRPSGAPTPKPAEDSKSIFGRFKIFLGGGWKTVYANYFSAKFSLSRLFRQSKYTSHIGLNALINNNGFRQDGSYQYGSAINDPLYEEKIKAEIDKSVNVMEKDRRATDYGEKISDSALNSLDRLLVLCRQRGIYVVGFLPPRPHKIYEAALAVDDLYKKTAIDLPKVAGDIFKKYGFSYYNFSDSQILGGSDTEFIDWSHGTDKMYLRLAIYLAEHDKKTTKYFDLKKLKAILKNTDRNFITSF